MTVSMFIEFYCNQGVKWNEDRKAMIYKGFTMETALEISEFIPPGFTPVDEWKDGEARWVWVSLYWKTIISYCDGDVFVERYNDLESFLQGLVHNQQFYTEEFVSVQDE